MNVELVEPSDLFVANSIERFLKKKTPTCELSDWDERGFGVTMRWNWPLDQQLGGDSPPGTAYTCGRCSQQPFETASCCWRSGPVTPRFWIGSTIVQATLLRISLEWSVGARVLQYYEYVIR